MFNRVAAYRNWPNCEYLVFSVKATDILMRYAIEFQRIEDGWLVKEDSERIDDEFMYRHISLNGIMCDIESWKEE